MDNLLTIKNKDMAFTSGLTGASTKAGGTKANSMESELTSTVRNKPLSTESGKLEKESNGSMSNKLRLLPKVHTILPMTLKILEVSVAL